MKKRYDTKYIGTNMHHLRSVILGMTQEEFGEITNLSKDTISNIERGKYRPNLESLVSISNAIDIPVEFFLHEPKEQVVLPVYPSGENAHSTEFAE